MARDASFVACLKTFSSKFDCQMIENFGIISSIFWQVAVTNKTRNSYVANLVPLIWSKKLLAVWGRLYLTDLQ